MQIASKYHVSESMNLIPGCNKKTQNCGLSDSDSIGGSTSASPQLKQSQMNSRQQTRTDSLEVNPDTLCRATHTTFSSKIPLGLHQYIPDIFGRIRCDFWNLLILDMVILWDIVHMRYFEQAKRRDCMMRRLQPPEQSPPSPQNPPSAELLWLPVIIRLRVCAWQLLRILCVVSLRYPPFSSCMQGFQKKMGDFHFYCVSLFLVTWSR